MAETKNNFLLLASLIGILGLLIGGLFGANLFPVTKTVEVEKIKEVAVPGPVQIKEVPIEKIVEKTVEVQVEKDYAGQAIATLLENLEDEDLDECDGDSYDLDQITVSKAYPEFAYKLLDEDDEKYEITAKVKLKYKQDDVKQCYDTLDFKVTYEAGEDEIISIL